VIILNLISSQCNLFEDPFFLSCSNESFLTLHLANNSNNVLFPKVVFVQTRLFMFPLSKLILPVLLPKTLQMKFSPKRQAFIGRHFNCPPQVFYFDTFFNGQSYNDKITLFVFLFVCLSLLVFCLQGDYFCKKKLY
jgi:hypothetical protein